MGIAFTIDSPVKVACFGITSALSIIEDNLIESMRKYYYERDQKPYVPISTKEDDYRSKRITDYLNLINLNIKERIEKIRNSAFEAGSDLVKYFEMLPEGSGMKMKYLQLLKTTDSQERRTLENYLRKTIRPGSIEVNIMTKVDKINLDKNGMPLENGSDALQALKGYTKSDLENSSIIFSAGMNPRLYNYMESFSEFDAMAWGVFKKRVVIKVSDYRSALIQGKYLAKKGIWVSEFRIESGLNCGGHAFATQGLLMGPILEEFKRKKEELSDALFNLYKPALQAKGKPTFEKAHPIGITVQGGIGTSEEAEFLHVNYGIDSTGWGTPFLLCPEATTVDEETLQLLSKAGKEDVVLSTNSPLGVPFSYLKGTSAEEEKRKRIEKGIPGSPCTEKYLVSNTEFTKEPICTASRKYQKLKLKQLKNSDLPEEEYQQQVDEVLAKECLCIGLSNAAPVKYEVPFLKKLTAVTICPGPNIANFSKLVSLQEMTNHIYGRKSLLTNEKRPHLFIKELELYVDYFRDQVNKSQNRDKKILRNLPDFYSNLMEGIVYYQDLTLYHCFPNNFSESIKLAEKELKDIYSKLEIQ